MIQGDIRDTPKLAEALQASTPSSTWPASPTMPASSSTRSCRPRSTTMPSSRWSIAAKKAGVKRFVYCLLELGLRRVATRPT